VRILASSPWRETACGGKSRTAVHHVRADAHGRREPVRADLSHPAEVLRDWHRSLLDPGRPRGHPGEPGSLHDANGRIIEVRQGLRQEVRPRPAVGIEHHQQRARRQAEGIVEVPVLAELTAFWPPQVPEAAGGADLAGLV
jgi:hypothetical protein